MDVRCCCCGEPWDTHYLNHDIIYEAISDGGLWQEDERSNSAIQHDLQDLVEERWTPGNLDQFVRDAFKHVGWEFGNSVYVVQHCPCCPHEKMDSGTQERVAAKNVVAELLNYDLDGQAAMLEEMDSCDSKTN